jgi:hypothetical protein
MARIRTIKPEHWSDKNLTNLPLPAHLLWIGTWNFSDDEGVFENDPVLIKSNVFPRRNDVRVEQVAQWLGQLVKARYIIPFVFNNVSYFIHRTFKAHQKIDRPNPSKVPAALIKKILDDDSTNDPRALVPVEESKVEESKVKGVYRKFAHLKISVDEFEKLKSSGYSKEDIDDILDKIQNYRANTKYSDLYMTANNWLKKDLKEKNSAKKEKEDGRGKSKFESTVDVFEGIRRDHGLFSFPRNSEGDDATEDQDFAPG